MTVGKQKKSEINKEIGDNEPGWISGRDVMTVASWGEWRGLYGKGIHTCDSCVRQWKSDAIN